MNDDKHHILCPLDGSDRAETVLAAIMPLVRAGTSRVTLLEVLADGAAPPEARAYSARARDALLAHHIPVECESRRGNPSEQILAFSRESGVDLIAMTSRARTGLSRMLHASVTEEVLRHADVPLLTCRSGQVLRDWKRILVPLDETVSVKDFLSDVSFLAGKTGASVELLQAVLPVPTIATGAGGMWMQAYGSGPESLTPFLKEASDFLASRGVDVHPTRRWILSGSGILDRLDEGDIDLVCMTTHGRRGLSRFFMGSTAEEVLRRAPCPVFVRRVAPRDSRGLKEPARVTTGTESSR
jgi:nucleotide-binding universal stress UspA family protein